MIGEYIKSDLKIDVRCNNKHLIDISLDSLARGRGCRSCVKSKGEMSVSEYLERNDIKFRSPLYKKIAGNKHYFDFYIEELNLFIEYDGEQHFYQSWYHEEGEFEKRCRRDLDKNNYTLENKSHFLRIPYWELDNIERILKKVFKILSKGINGLIVPYANYFENLNEKYFICIEEEIE
jgi:very-short-patch-repair endonuclease